MSVLLGLPRLLLQKFSDAWNSLPSCPPAAGGGGSKKKETRCCSLFAHLPSLQTWSMKLLLR